MARPTSTGIQIKLEPLDNSTVFEANTSAKSESELFAELQEAVKHAGLCNKPLSAMRETQGLTDDSGETNVQGIRQKLKHVRCKFSIRNTVTPAMDSLVEENPQTDHNECPFSTVTVKSEYPGEHGDRKPLRCYPETAECSNELSFFESSDNTYLQGLPHHNAANTTETQFLQSNATSNNQSYGNGDNIPYPFPNWLPPPMPENNLFAPLYNGTVQLPVADQDVPSIGSETIDHPSPLHSYNGCPEGIPVISNDFPMLQSYNSNLFMPIIYNNLFSQPMYPQIRNDGKTFPLFVNSENLLSQRDITEEKAKITSLRSIPPAMRIASPPFPSSQLPRTSPPVLHAEPYVGRQRLLVKERRPRKSFTNEQLRILQQRFAISDRISTVERHAMAAQLEVTDRQIRVWFQNQRAKRKASAKAMKEIMESGCFMTATAQQLIQNVHMNSTLF